MRHQWCTASDHFYCSNNIVISQDRALPTRLRVCPAKTQISLCIQSDQFLQDLLRVAKEPKHLQVDSEYSDQTAWMPKLI